MQRRDFFAISFAGLAAPQVPAQVSRHDLPFRQIHLDFHTSELIPNVGADFKPQEFLATLQAARVNSINIFAKCHHGLAYYDSTIAKRHPSLKIDLLGQMIGALKPAGIEVNYYYSLVWDVATSRAHPEWRARNADGSAVESNQWPWLCMNSPYLDQVARENQEILDRYTVDGSWFDILKQPVDGCYCQYCVADRKKLGLSTSTADIFTHNKLVALKVEKLLFGMTRRKYPNAASFFNSRLVIGMKDELPYYSHIELESLPTGGWGYSHFQQRVRYFRTFGMQMVGMTGRFHKSWGDFGGYKNQAALDFECLNFLANGTKVCVGDQLHPGGKLDPLTYDRIGKTYARLEALEPWHKGARAVADIGVFSSSAFDTKQSTQKIAPVDQGFTNLLLELHHQFDILDPSSDLTPYKVLILPDEIPGRPEFVARLQAYLDQGGSLIVSHRSLLDESAGKFSLDLGVRYNGPAKFKNAYLSLDPKAFSAIGDKEANASWFLYQTGLSVAASPGTEVLATYTQPFFDRSADSFSSHKQTPPGSRTTEPLITQKGRIIYIANPFFLSYSQDAYGIQKSVVNRLLARLLPQPLIQTNLPSGAQITALRQQERHILHVLYYPLTRRAPDLDIIEEPGLLENIAIGFRSPKRPTRVALLPGLEPLNFTHESGYASLVLPRVLGHQALLVE